MNDLPFEVIHDIARWLPQHELLCFAVTCKRIYNTVHSQIYQAVTIDSSRRVFDDETDVEKDKLYVDTCFESVVIRSLFALTRFLKTLVEHPEYARHVHFVVARSQFPDIPQLELHRLLEQVFPSLVNLQVLAWYSASCPLPAELLLLLPHPEYLQILGGNFTNLAAGLPKQKFPNIRHVDFSNLATECLAGINFERFPNIDTLTLSRTASRNRLSFSSHLSGCCRNVLDSNMENIATLMAPFKSSTFLNPTTKKPLRLHSFSLRGVSLTAGDARTLLARIDGPSLRNLAINDCFEDFSENEFFQANRRSPPSLTFVDYLFKELAGLESLNISIANELCYNGATFRAISGLQGLSKLSIHIKNYCRNGPVDLAPLVDSLRSHKNTLQYLNICSDVVARNSTPCPKKRNFYELKSIRDLSNLACLKYLCIPVGFSQITALANTLSPLKAMEILHLLVTDSESVASIRSCDGCPNTLTYSLCSSNSLIAQEYFNCGTSFAQTFEQEKRQRYLEFAASYQKTFKKLVYMRFDTKDTSLVFDCRTEEAREVSVDRFDSWVNQHLRLY